MDKLTKAEEEIMILIWKLGACTVSQIMGQLPEPKPAQTTVSSFVRILEKKGYVDHKTYGRTYEYYPIIEKSAYSRMKLKSLMTNYFEGSPQALVSFLVKDDKLSVSDMQSLIDQIAEDED